MPQGLSGLIYKGPVLSTVRRRHDKSFRRQSIEEGLLKLAYTCGMTKPGTNVLLSWQGSTTTLQSHLYLKMRLNSDAHRIKYPRLIQLKFLSINTYRQSPGLGYSIVLMLNAPIFEPHGHDGVKSS